MQQSRCFRLACYWLACIVLLLACGGDEGGTAPPPVDPLRPATVTVTPSAAELHALGETVRLTAEVRDQNGQVMAGASVTWTSSAPGVATVESGGTVTATGNGVATITATAGAVSGTAQVTTAQVPASMSMVPSRYRLIAEGHVRATAVVSDANGHEVAGASLTWTSSDSAVATVDEMGRISALAPGTALMMAASGELAATSEIVVVVPPPVRAVDIASVPTNGGSHDGSGSWDLPVNEVFTRTLTARPNPGYDFDHWAEGDVPISRDSVFSMQLAGAHTLSARFSVNPERGKWGPGNTYTDWYFPGSAYESFAWTFASVVDPPESLKRKGLLHYYAFNFGLHNANASVGFGYAGLQSDGRFRGVSIDSKAVNFAIWGSNGAHTADGMVWPANTECRCYQIMLPYEYETGRSYRFELRPGPGGVEEQGKWWRLWVTDLATDSITFVGETRVPTVIDGKPATMWRPHASVFGEDLYWWRSRNGSEGYICSDFEPSSLAVLDVTAGEQEDRASRVSPWTTDGRTDIAENGYETRLCHVTVFTAENGDVQHNVGFWPEPPKNVLGRSP